MKGRALKDITNGEVLKSTRNVNEQDECDTVADGVYRGIYFNSDAERRAKHTEVFQHRVMKEYARIINIPMEYKKNYDDVIKEFLQWIR